MRPNNGLCSATESFLELLSNGNNSLKNYFTAEGLQVEGYKPGNDMDVFSLSLVLGTMICVSIR